MMKWGQHHVVIRCTSFLSHKQKRLCDSYGSSTIYQWIWGESYGPVHLEIDAQTMVQAVEPVEKWTCPNFSCCGWEKNLENANLGRHTRSEDKFQKSSLPEGRFHWGKKKKREREEVKKELWHSGNSKRILPFLPHS